MSDRVAVDDTTSRVPPLARPWSDDDAAGIGAWGHPAATYPPLLLTRTLQRHPQLAARTRHLGEGLYIDGRLSHRDRTIAILRTCAQVRCAYEWGGQAAFWGPIAKVSDDECDALAVGQPDDPRWSDGERTIVKGDRRARGHRHLDRCHLGVALGAPRRGAADGAPHRRRLVPDHLHALQRADPRHRGLDAPLAGGRLVNLPAWAVRRTRTMSRVYFGTVVLAAAGSLVGGGAAIVSGAIDEDYSNVVGGVVSVMLGGCWAAVAHFARPMDLRKPR